VVHIKAFNFFPPLFLDADGQKPLSWAVTLVQTLLWLMWIIFFAVFPDAGLAGNGYFRDPFFFLRSWFGFTSFRFLGFSPFFPCRFSLSQMADNREEAFYHPDVAPSTFFSLSVAVVLRE